MAEPTLDTNRGAVRARLIPLFGGDTPLGDVTTERIDAYIEHGSGRRALVTGAWMPPMREATCLRPAELDRD